MSQFVEGVVKTFLAGEDLSAKEGYIAKISSGKAVLAAAATQNLIGVIRRNDGGDGNSVSIQISGTAKIKAGGSISEGAWVTSDSAGKGVATTTNKDTVIGRALQAADSGDIIEVELGIFTLSS